MNRFVGSYYFTWSFKCTLLLHGQPAHRTGPHCLAVSWSTCRLLLTSPHEHLTGLDTASGPYIQFAGSDVPLVAFVG